MRGEVARQQGKLNSLAVFGSREKPPQLSHTNEVYSFFINNTHTHTHTQSHTIMQCQDPEGFEKHLISPMQLGAVLQIRAPSVLCIHPHYDLPIPSDPQAERKNMQAHLCAFAFAFACVRECAAHVCFIIHTHVWILFQPRDTCQRYTKMMFSSPPFSFLFLNNMPKKYPLTNFV